MPEFGRTHRFAPRAPDLTSGAIDEATPEQQEILNSVEQFAEYVVGRWPQVDENTRMIIPVDDHGTTVELPKIPDAMQSEPVMNYYLSGSLAVMLLARAESFTEMDEGCMPALREGTTHPVPERARRLLATFARPVGDLDYVPTDFYRAKQAHVQASYRRGEEDEYERARAQYLWKGGGGPSLKELPDGAKMCLKNSDQSMVMCDPLQAYGAKRVAKIHLNSRDYYIARPDTIFSYKVLHLLQNYHNKPEKFNTDFGKLLAAMRELYTDDELIRITREVLSDFEYALEALHRELNEDRPNQPAYERAIPVFMNRVFAHPDTTAQIRELLESIQRS